MKSYCFKMVRYRHMDFELARFLMKQSLIGPKKLYLHTKRSKQIKNQWHRDDPCLTVVNIVSLVFCAFLIELSYNVESLQAFICNWILTSLGFAFVHFLAFGVVASFASKRIAEKFLRKDEKVSIHGPSGGHLIEPMYSFDIHCNAFFPVIIFNYFGNVSCNFS